MRNFNLAFTIGATLLIATGCGSKPATTTSDAAVEMNSLPPDNADVHSHPSEGPHHGTLVELGNEEFHAEVIHDNNSVTIYVLDSSATKAVPIDASELTINLMHDGTPEQYKLAATPDDADPNGKSSRFTIADAELVGHIDDDTAAPKLTLTINGTPYRGEIKHDHDGHDHGGHDHSGHDH
ncbi:hypothetical protein [Rubripirellula reticaptiva]|nr:hypothetical protein [Rubripirellula reticaptiva]